MGNRYTETARGGSYFRELGVIGKAVDIFFHWAALWSMKPDSPGNPGVTQKSNLESGSLPVHLISKLSKWPLIPMKSASYEYLKAPTLWFLFSHQVVFNSLWPCELQYSRLSCSSVSPRVCSNACPLHLWYYPTISSSTLSQALLLPWTECLCLPKIHMWKLKSPLWWYLELEPGGGKAFMVALVPLRRRDRKVLSSSHYSHSLSLPPTCDYMARRQMSASQKEVLTSTWHFWSSLILNFQLPEPWDMHAGGWSQPMVFVLAPGAISCHIPIHPLPSSGFSPLQYRSDTMGQNDLPKNHF